MYNIIVIIWWLFARPRKINNSVMEIRWLGNVKTSDCGWVFLLSRKLSETMFKLHDVNFSVAALTDGTFLFSENFSFEESELEWDHKKWENPKTPHDWKAYLLQIAIWEIPWHIFTGWSPQFLPFFVVPKLLGLWGLWLWHCRPTVKFCLFSSNNFGNFLREFKMEMGVNKKTLNGSERCAVWSPYNSVNACKQNKKIFTFNFHFKISF